VSAANCLGSGEPHGVISQSMNTTKLREREPPNTSAQGVANKSQSQGLRCIDVRTLDLFRGALNLRLRLPGPQNSAIGPRLTRPKMPDY